MPTRAEVLRLYKHLMKYSKSLSLTDPTFFRRKISTEFKKNKDLANVEDIAFAFQKGEALLRRGSVV